MSIQLPVYETISKNDTLINLITDFYTHMLLNPSKISTNKKLPVYEMIPKNDTLINLITDFYTNLLL
jgi:truncated hemoglobin YjbI